MKGFTHWLPGCTPETKDQDCRPADKCISGKCTPSLCHELKVANSKFESERACQESAGFESGCQGILHCNPGFIYIHSKTEVTQSVQVTCAANIGSQTPKWFAKSGANQLKPTGQCVPGCIVNSDCEGSCTECSKAFACVKKQCPATLDLALNQGQAHVDPKTGQGRIACNHGFILEVSAAVGILC